MADEIVSWPEFVGADAKEVQNKLKAQGYHPEILLSGSPCTYDFRLDRVRLFVDLNNKIIQTPSTG